MVENLNSQILNFEKENNIKEPTNVIENIMDEYWNNNQSNLLPLYQSLNPNSKKSVKSEINALEIFYQKIYLQTIILDNTNTNNNINKEFDQYSFKCLTNSLNYKILKGTKEVSFKIELENNGSSLGLEMKLFY